MMCWVGRFPAPRADGGDVSREVLPPETPAVAEPRGALVKLEAPQLPVNGIEILSSDLPFRHGVRVVESSHEDAAELGQIL